MSQNEAIRIYLGNGLAITPLYAMRAFGCLRLAARISDLRRAGLDIRTDMRTINGKRIAVYHLHQEGSR